MTAVISMMPPTLVPTAINEIPMGRTAATIVPKTTSRTRSADQEPDGDVRRGLSLSLEEHGGATELHLEAVDHDTGHRL